MIDIHCHILPCLDDGPEDMETSLAMARDALGQGITTVIATPHCIPEVFFNERNAVMEAVMNFQNRLEREGIPLRVIPGMEVHLTLDVPQRLAGGSALTVGDLGKHVLLELPLSTVPGYTEQVIFEIMLKGIVPIIAHPERNKGIAGNPQLLHRLLEKGCLVQVTSGSLTGEFGQRIQKLTKEFLQLGWVDFIATDAHHPVKRAPLMKQAYLIASELMGEETANKLVLDNPWRLLKGESISKGNVLSYSSCEKSNRKKKNISFFNCLVNIFRKRT